jgi:hypothetical protein
VINFIRVCILIAVILSSAALLQKHTNMCYFTCQTKAHKCVTLHVRQSCDTHLIIELSHLINELLHFSLPALPNQLND